MTAHGAIEPAGAWARIIPRWSVLRLKRGGEPIALISRPQGQLPAVGRCSEYPSDDLVRIRIKAAAMTEHDSLRLP